MAATGNQKLAFAIRAVNEAQAALKEFEGNLDSVGRAADAAGTKGEGFGSKFAAGIGVAAAGIAGLSVAAGGALLKLGMSFDDAYDRIAVGTGATGETLEGLEESFKRVFTSVPTDMDSAATAIADLNTRLGFTGPQLESVSATMLELSRLTGTDLSTNIEQVSRAMQDWGETGEDAVNVLDELFVASQNSGVTVDRLASSLVQFGGPMRQLGFSMEQATALIAKFEREGVNTELVLGSMRQALGRMAREGEPAVETFQRVVEEIKNAGSASEANAIALELFGARAGPDMAAAIREGRFEIEELVAAIQGSDGAVMEASQSTADFGEQWTILKNKIMVALEPAAAAVLDFANTFTEKAIPKIEEFMVWAEPRIREFAEFFRTEVVPAIAAAIEEVRPHFQKFMQYWESDLKPAFENIRIAVEAVVGWFRDNWGQIEPIIVPIIEAVARRIEFIATVFRETIAIIVDLIQGDWSGAWSNMRDIGVAFLDLFKGDLDGLITFVRGLASLAWDAAKYLGEQLLDGLWQGIQAGWALVRTWFGNLTLFISSAVGDLLSFGWDIGWSIIEGIKNGVLGAWEWFKDEILGKVDPRNWDVPGLSPLLDAYEHAGQIAGGRLIDGLAHGIEMSVPLLQRAVQAVTRLVGAELGGGATPWGHASFVPSPPGAIYAGTPWESLANPNESADMQIASVVAYGGIGYDPQEKLRMQAQLEAQRAFNEGPAVGLSPFDQRVLEPLMASAYSGRSGGGGGGTPSPRTVNFNQITIIGYDDVHELRRKLLAAGVFD